MKLRTAVGILLSLMLISGSVAKVNAEAPGDTPENVEQIAESQQDNQDHQQEALDTQQEVSNDEEDVGEGESISEESGDTTVAESEGDVPLTKASYSGFVTINGQLYYYDPATGERLKGLRVIDGNTYYFQKSGAAASGRQTVDGLTYYFDPVTHRQSTGIVEVDYSTVKRKHYFLAEGGLASGWIEENGKKYYFSSPESEAIMLTGVQLIDEKIYYFDSSTGEAKEGICENSEGQKFYFTLDGVKKTGLQKWNGELYYCKAGQSGAVQYGFQSVDETLYFFDRTTGAAWKNMSFTYGHIKFTINETGIITAITAEKGYEDNVRVRLIINGLSRLGGEGVFCGAFTKEVSKESGLGQVQGASYEQARDIVNGKYGTLIKQSELRMGDLIFWRWDNCGNLNCEHWEEIHHVGFYMGNGNVLEAASTDGTVSDGGMVQVESLRSYSGFEIKYYARVADDINDDFLDENLQHATLGKSKNIKAISSGKNKVTLTWDVVEGADGYLIYAQKSGKYAYCGMTTTGSKFIDTKALDLEYNFYWVFPYVKDSSGKMHPSGTEKYVFAKGITTGVSGLKAGSIKGGVKLTWNKVNDAEGYLIYGIINGKTYGYVGMTTKGTTYTDKKASKTVYNYYWVFPYHKNSNGKMITGGTTKYTYGRAL